MEFEWDPSKEEANVEKHGITFTDASTVFKDPYHLTEESTKPEYGEERNLAIGMVAGRLVTGVNPQKRTTSKVNFSDGAVELLPSRGVHDGTRTNIQS